MIFTLSLRYQNMNQINQYRIQCSEVNYFTVLVEAETMQEAEDLLHKDINAFDIEDEYSGEWVIEDIEEL